MNGSPHTRTAHEPFTRQDRVTRQRPCRICGKTDYCINQARRALCMRVESDHRARCGGWWHYDRRDEIRTRHTPRLKPKPTHEQPRAADDHLHAVYSAFLDRLTLTSAHTSKLTERGLSASTIVRNGYKTTPASDEAQAIARSLANSFDLRGVPGFYRERGMPQMVRSAHGFFVPVRNGDSRIVGLMIRRDEGKPKYYWLSSSEDRDGNPREAGASPGARLHFAQPRTLRQTDELLISEGALKSDVIAALTRTPVIGIAGVSTFGEDFAQSLRQKLPHTRHAIIAYDTDQLENDHVWEALERLSKQLAQAGFRVRVRTWDERFKGYDDFLLSQIRIQGVTE